MVAYCAGGGPSNYNTRRTQFMYVTQWFNPHNREHVMAWEEMQRTGHFPRDNVPEYVTFPVGFASRLTQKMADAWFHHVRINFS